MQLRFDWGSREPENTLKLAKFFLLGFFVGETFLLVLLGALT